MMASKKNLMKILTRDDTEHDVEYVTLAEAAKEIAVWEHEAKILRDKLKAAHENAIDWFTSYQELKLAVGQTLEENRHLADGDICTLKVLRDAYTKLGGEERCRMMDDAGDALTAVEFVRRYNRWRRGDESLEMESPKAIGEALDAVCDRVEMLERWLEEGKRNGARCAEERDRLQDAVRSYRDAKGRYHTQKACERLLALLPEND